MAQSPWWEHISDIMARCSEPRKDTNQPSRYRFGEIQLNFDCNDSEFSSRFQRIFGECLLAAEDNQQELELDLHIRSVHSDAVSIITLSEPTTIDRASFISQLFPTNKYQANGTTTDGWLLITSSDTDTPVIALKNSIIVVSASHNWQIVMAHFVVASAMRLQPEVCFFHGATMAMDQHGVMLSGDKGAGKTTLSLALAARGHGFLSDEYAGVKWQDFRIVPFRRSASIRPGAQTSVVAKYLVDHDCPQEVLADGTKRTRVSVSRMLPDAFVQDALLTHVFFLKGFSETPSVERFEFGMRHIDLLAPLLGTLWQMPVMQRTLYFLKIFSHANCYLLTAGGTPDETAQLIETTLKDNENVDTTTR